MNLSFDFTELCNLIDELQPCMDDYLYIYNYDLDTYHISQKACEHFNFPDNHFTNVLDVLKKVVYYEDYPNLVKELSQVRQTLNSFHNLEYRWLTPNGNPVWINCRGKTMLLENGNTILLGSIIDIGALQKADPVSGLLSINSLHELISNHEPKKYSGYLLRIGIDNFKDVMDKLGADYGDLIIREITTCIKPHVISNQFLYRLFGDEFIIIDISGNDVQKAYEQYKTIRNSVDDFIEKNHYEAVFTISAGIFPISSYTQLSLANYMKYSEFALQEAKRRGKNQAYIFCQTDYDAFVRIRDVNKALRQSVNHNFEGFSLYLQPLYNVKQHAISGAESLLRFSTPELGMISPTEFIPLLENSGLIIPVGKWVLHTALKMCEEISQFVPGFKIGINVSSIQIKKSNIISEIIGAVPCYDIHPSQVTIELTESGMLCPDVIIKKMWRKLTKQGVNLALDDFGTGYSNFHYIDDIHPQFIKIDRTFTAKACENEWFYHLLSLLSDMLHKLDIRLCIEGIETIEEFKKVNTFEPDVLQGYLWGKPYSYDEFVSKLKNNEFIVPLDS